MLKPGEKVDQLLAPGNRFAPKCPICDAALVATGSAASTGEFVEDARGRTVEVRERLYATCPRDPSHTGLVPLEVGVG